MKQSTEVSEHTKAAGKELSRTWGSKPQVFRHWDEPEERWVAIATCVNCPQEGITATGTLGLSDHDLGLGNDLRVELIGASDSSAALFPNVLATCAFNAIKVGWPMHPGAIHNGVVRMYDLSATLDHVMFVDPFLWDDGPKTLHLDGRTIAWLMAVPISESEMAFAMENGADELSNLFEKHQIDVFDLNRESVV